MIRWYLLLGTLFVATCIVGTLLLSHPIALAIYSAIMGAAFFVAWVNLQMMNRLDRNVKSVHNVER